MNAAITVFQKPRYVDVGFIWVSPCRMVWVKTVRKKLSRSKMAGTVFGLSLLLVNEVKAAFVEDTLCRT